MIAVLGIFTSSVAKKVSLIIGFSLFQAGVIYGTYLYANPPYPKGDPRLDFEELAELEAIKKQRQRATYAQKVWAKRLEKLGDNAVKESDQLLLTAAYKESASLYPAPESLLMTAEILYKSKGSFFRRCEPEDHDEIMQAKNFALKIMHNGLSLEKQNSNAP